jgi:hypothetical protein
VIGTRDSSKIVYGFVVDKFHVRLRWPSIRWPSTVGVLEF